MARQVPARFNTTAREPAEYLVALKTRNGPKPVCGTITKFVPDSEKCNIGGQGWVAHEGVELPFTTHCCFSRQFKPGDHVVFHLKVDPVNPSQVHVNNIQTSDRVLW